jgi:hypothetical protein
MSCVASAVLFWGHCVIAQVQEIHKDCVTLSAPGHYPDYGPMLRYSVQRREFASDKTLALQISVSPADYGQTALIRLACKLGADNVASGKVDALIFDDKKAARNLAAGFTDQRNNAIYLWHLRAHYALDRGAQTEYIEFVEPVFKENLLTLRKLKIILTRSGQS